MREARRVFDLGMGSASANVRVGQGDGEHIARASCQKDVSDEVEAEDPNVKKRRREETGQDERGGNGGNEGGLGRCHWDLCFEAVVAAVKSLEVRDT